MTLAQDAGGWAPSKGACLRLYSNQTEEPEWEPCVKDSSPRSSLCSLLLERERLMRRAVSVRITRPGFAFWMLMDSEAGRQGHANYTSGRYHYTCSHLPDGQTFQSLNIVSTEGKGREMVSLRNC